MTFESYSSDKETTPPDVLPPDAVHGEEINAQEMVGSEQAMSELEKETGIPRTALEKIAASPRLRKIFFVAVAALGIFIGTETHAQDKDSSATTTKMEQSSNETEADSALIDLIKVVQEKKLFEDWDYYSHAEIGKYVIEYQGKDKDPQAYYNKVRCDVSFKDDEGSNVVIGHNFGVFQAVACNDREVDSSFKKMTIREFKKTYGIILRGAEEDIVYAKIYSPQEAARLMHQIATDVRTFKK